MNKKLQLINDTIKIVKNFPTRGISFKDLTPILANQKVLKLTIKEMANLVKGKKFDYVAALESRGFWFGIPLAYELNLPFIPVRKKGKLPRKTLQASYDLEYGKDAIEIHKEDIKPGSRILLVDDIIATGGTIIAAKKLMDQAKAKCEDVVVIAYLDEIPEAIDRIEKAGIKVHNLIKL